MCLLSPSPSLPLSFFPTPPLSPSGSAGRPTAPWRRRRRRSGGFSGGGCQRVHGAPLECDSGDCAGGLPSTLYALGSSVLGVGPAGRRTDLIMSPRSSPKRWMGPTYFRVDRRAARTDWAGTKKALLIRAGKERRRLWLWGQTMAGKSCGCRGQNRAEIRRALPKTGKLQHCVDRIIKEFANS